MPKKQLQNPEEWVNIKMELFGKKNQWFHLNEYGDG